MEPSFNAFSSCYVALLPPFLFGQSSFSFVNISGVYPSSFNIPNIMGRVKLAIKKLDSPVARQLMYAKRKKSIIKKAAELSVLCNSDIGVIMFSPTGRLTRFSGHGRLEDVLIRFLRQSDQTQGVAIEDKEHLIDSLVDLKYEAQIMELLAEKEALEKEFEALRDRLNVAQNILRIYNPGLYNVASIHPAEASEKSITNALLRVKQQKEKLLGTHISDQEAETIEIPEGEIADADQMIEELLESNPILPGDQPREDNLQETRSSLMGRHLSISSITEKCNWYLPGSKLPFEEIVGHELFNAPPDGQQNMEGSSDVAMGGLIGKPEIREDLTADF